MGINRYHQYLILPIVTNKLNTVQFSVFQARILVSCFSSLSLDYITRDYWILLWNKKQCRPEGHKCLLDKTLAKDYFSLKSIVI